MGESLRYPSRAIRELLNLRRGMNAAMNHGATPGGDNQPNEQNRNNALAGRSNLAVLCGGRYANRAGDLAEPCVPLR